VSPVATRSGNCSSAFRSVCLSAVILVASLSQSVAADIPNVRDYGAIGDGNSHPACQTLHLPSLSALQDWHAGRYRFANSCDNEMDWLAAKAAMAEGHNVFYPEGMFVNDQTIVLPAALQGDSTRKPTQPSSSISLAGVSHERSALVWTRDLGAGKAAVECADRLTTGTGCAGRIEHLSLIGPGRWQGVGKPVAMMDGLAWGARREVNDVFIARFNKCFSLVGDQTAISQLLLHECSYGIYFENPNPYLHGDMVFLKPIIDHASIAGIGVASNANINEITWIGLLVAATPWGILKEMKGERFSAEVTHGSTFISTQFEHIGNGLIGDDAPGPERQATDYNTKWLQTEFVWDRAYTLPGTEPDGIFNLRQSYLMVIDGIREPGQWKPGRYGIFNIRFPTQSKVMGDLPTLLRNAASANRPFSRYDSDTWLGETPGMPPQPVSDLKVKP
jgi:hypothetical protein